MRNRLIFLAWFPLLFVLAGCIPGTLSTEVAMEPQATPTIASFFLAREGIEAIVAPPVGNSEGIPTVSSLFSARETPTPASRPSSPPLPTLTPRQSPLEQTGVFTATVFDDALNDNWDIVEQAGATIDINSDDRVFHGRRSIAYTPDSAFSTLFFVVNPTATTVYPLQQVLGISLWLNGGDDYIELDQLAIAVIGSNEYTYWVADDNSVDFPQGEAFSETRLYFLGLNRSIPPETWVEIYLPLDALIYDPEYSNVVGFYLKNDADFTNTVYVDTVSLVMLKDVDDTIPAAEIMVPPTPTPTPIAPLPVEPETVPTATMTVAPTITATASPTLTPGPETCVVSPPPGWELYTIQSGDNISNLAFERGESAQRVIGVNCLESSAVISIGQSLWLPPLP